MKSFFSAHGATWFRGLTWQSLLRTSPSLEYNKQGEYVSSTTPGYLGMYSGRVFLDGSFRCRTGDGALAKGQIYPKYLNFSSPVTLQTLSALNVILLLSAPRLCLPILVRCTPQICLMSGNLIGALGKWQHLDGNTANLPCSILSRVNKICCGPRIERYSREM